MDSITCLLGQYPHGTQTYHVCQRIIPGDERLNRSIANLAQPPYLFRAGFSSSKGDDP
jgi:hypothetical protein